MKFRVGIVIVMALAAGACKSKAKDEKAGSGTGTASASGTGTASASGSGTASASGTASGTGSGTASGTGTGTSALAPISDADALAMMADVKAKMCACPDVACLEAEEAKAKELEFDDSKLSEDTIGKMDTTEDEIQACALKIAEATPLPGEHAAEGAPLLAEFKKVRDAMCKCADMPCVAEAGKDIEATDAKVRELFPPDDDDHLPAAFEAVMKSAQLCVEKLVPADQPVP